jgi:ATP-dependent helicase HrpA
LACDYRFTPGEAEDGVTVRVPLRAAGALSGDTFQWLVPGLLKEKIAALIKALPKELRKQLVPVNDTVQTIVTQMPIQRDISLGTALSRFVRRQWGVEIPALLWNENQLPDHLRMRIAVTDDNGQIVLAGRDAAVLRQSAPANAPEAFKQAQQAYEHGPIAQWDFDDLPETIVLSGPARTRHTAYPALELRDNIIVRTAFAELAAARAAHPKAIKALLVQRLGAEIKFLRRNLILPYSVDAQCRYFGGRPALEEQLIERVLDDHLAKDIRTREAFDTLLEELHQQNITAWGQTFKQHVLALLDAYQSCRLALAGIEKAHPANGPLHHFLNELREGLQHLVPENFIALYDETRLQQLPRYLRATTLRAERAAVDLEKDRGKAQQIAPYESRLRAMIQELTPQSSEEKRRAVEAFFWALEEFKISLFAQQIKTLRPVSAKRLDAMSKEINDFI